MDTPRTTVKSSIAKTKASMGWHDSLFGLLARGRTASDQISDVIIVDNAKIHRRAPQHRHRAAPPSSPMPDSTDNFRLIFDSFLCEDDNDEDLIRGSSDHFHNSYPCPYTRSKSGVTRKNVPAASESFNRWGSLSDSQLGNITLDDMLHEDSVLSKSNVPPPVRQQSLDGPDFQDILLELGLDQDDQDSPARDQSPSFVQRRRSFSLGG